MNIPGLILFGAAGSSSILRRRLPLSFIGSFSTSQVKYKINPYSKQFLLKKRLSFANSRYDSLNQRGFIAIQIESVSSATPLSKCLNFYCLIRGLLTSLNHLYLLQQSLLNVSKNYFLLLLLIFCSWSGILPHNTSNARTISLAAAISPPPTGIICVLSANRGHFFSS